MHYMIFVIILLNVNNVKNALCIYLVVKNNTEVKFDVYKSVWTKITSTGIKQLSWTYPIWAENSLHISLDWPAISVIGERTVE